MKRFTTWTIFATSLLLVLGVMLFFTVKMLRFEKAMANADARAALEENVRLALWRMDSAETLTLALSHRTPPSDRSSRQNANSNFQQLQNSNSLNSLARNTPQAQQQMSEQEFQMRQNLPAQSERDWRQDQSALLRSISDILPGATLEPVDPKTANSNDTRRLASIPARLVVPPSDMPSSDLPWKTPLRISLAVAWIAAILAAAAIARLLGATLSLSERRGAFAATVTHELRTPVTTCRMYSEMLATGVIADPAVRQQYLQTLAAESDRLAHLIENVLTYSRLERKFSPQALESIALSDLIDRALPSIRRRCEQASVNLNINLPPEGSAFQCRADAVAVQQILLNLVDNACKFGRTDIDLTAKLDSHQILIQVKDHGPGLDAARAKTLFVAFSKSKTDTVPGIGLGLNLSKRLAREMGGDLRYHAANPGAEFVLSLPSA